MSWRANPDEEMADWRAVCGRTARTVRREGRGNPSLPYRVFQCRLRLRHAREGGRYRYPVRFFSDELSRYIPSNHVIPLTECLGSRYAFLMNWEVEYTDDVHLKQLFVEGLINGQKIR